jgi:hypothetical protein
MALTKVNLIHKNICDALEALTVEAEVLEDFHLYREIPLTDDLIFPNLCVIRKPLGTVRNLMNMSKVDAVTIIIMLGFREKDLSLVVNDERLETEGLLNHYQAVLEDFYEHLSEVLDPSIKVREKSFTVNPNYPTEEGNDRYVLEFTINIQYMESRR